MKVIILLYEVFPPRLIQMSVVEEPVLPPTEIKRVEFTKQVKSSEQKGSNEKVSYSIKYLI